MSQKKLKTRKFVFSLPDSQQFAFLTALYEAADGVAAPIKVITEERLPRQL